LVIRPNKGLEQTAIIRFHGHYFNKKNHLKENVREISGSHGGEYEGDSLLGIATLFSLKYIDVSEVRTASIIALMMEGVSSYLIHGDTYRKTAIFIPVTIITSNLTNFCVPLILFNVRFFVPNFY
jgi:hypothetical protein